MATTPATTRAAPPAQPDGATNGGGGSAEEGRKIVRTTEVDLAIKDLNSALGEIRTIAGQASGFVSQSNVVVSNSDDPQAAQPRTSIITIRVPNDQYDDVMNRLRGIAAGVDEEQSNVSEVTSQYTDLQARLANLQKAEAAYVALLDQADSIEEILRVQEQVNDTQGEIEQAQGQLNVLNNQADLATIKISLRLAAVPIANGNGNWATHAFNVSLNTSEEMAIVLGTTAIAGAFATIWLIPVLLIAYLVWRRFGARLIAVAKKLD